MTGSSARHALTSPVPGSNRLLRLRSTIGTTTSAVVAQVSPTEPSVAMSEVRGHLTTSRSGRAWSLAVLNTPNATQLGLDRLRVLPLATACSNRPTPTLADGRTTVLYRPGQLPDVALDVVADVTRVSTASTYVVAVQIRAPLPR